MNKEYIQVKIPILNDIEEMEVVKTFNEEQLWYVCAIAKAFENEMKKSKMQEQALNEIKETIENDCDFNGTGIFDKWIPSKKILQIIEKVGGNE